LARRREASTEMQGVWSSETLVKVVMVTDCDNRGGQEDEIDM
jgi:hypothetical protein